MHTILCASIGYKSQSNIIGEGGESKEDTFEGKLDIKSVDGWAMRDQSAVIEIDSVRCWQTLKSSSENIRNCIKCQQLK